MPAKFLAFDAGPVARVSTRSPRGLSGPSPAAAARRLLGTGVGIVPGWTRSAAAVVGSAGQRARVLVR
ncbi:hypothetical protein [Mycolicibacterium madagascariense]|uniref:hypothetical protein n=1 Tax=Mycolicibacterium madagascariense TaxID=212765 RepID=UPI0013D30DD3|nr:hypothetical protein [Mycolicibacterium madagascariense]MCV7013323.1 hypothetical protein [Mycolicibacterium madagascariense]